MSLFTPWFEPGVKPVRNGWYEVARVGWVRHFYWHNRAWFDNAIDFRREYVIGYDDGQPYRWRGLTRDLQEEAC